MSHTNYSCYFVLSLWNTKECNCVQLAKILNNNVKLEKKNHKCNLQFLKSGPERQCSSPLGTESVKQKEFRTLNLKE